MSQLTKNFSNSGPGGFIQTITGDAGVPVVPAAGNVNVFGQGTVTPTTIANSGIVFTGAGNTLSATVNYLNMPATNATGFGIVYVGGFRTLSFPVNVTNLMIGAFDGNLTMTGTNNTFVGYGNGALITSGNTNTACGFQNLQNITTGLINTAIGASCLDNITSGSYNVAIGDTAGTNLTANDSSNIYINHSGVSGDNHTMRLGVTGSATSEVNRCFIAGVDGVNVGSVAKVLTMASEQLGTATITAGTGITVTPGANTITIAATGTTTLTYTPVNTSPYVVLSTDEFLGVDCSAGAITIQLPNAPSAGRTFTIKDRTGSAAIHNITVTTVGGVVNIDGAASFLMNTAYESINVLFDGSTYQIW